MTANLLRAAETRAEFLLDIMRSIANTNMDIAGYRNKDIAKRDANEIMHEIQHFIAQMHSRELLEIKYYTSRKRAEIAEQKLKELGI
jgi:hypothetical protein